MRRSLLSMLCLGAVSACATFSAQAYEFRARFVRWNGAAWEPMCNSTLYGAPGSTHRIRIEAGVFDDAKGEAPAGGFVGWVVGTLDATGGTNTRTPGCLITLPPSTCPCRPMAGCPDPFLNLEGIDVTFGTQSPVWACNRDGEAPPQPDPVIRGRNSYVQLFEFTTVPGATSYSVTAGGNLLGALEWRVIGTPQAPDCGEPGPEDDIPGAITYAPFPTPPVAFSETLEVVVSDNPDCLGDGTPDVCQPAVSQRLYSISGTSSGAGWSWCVTSGAFPSVCDLLVPGVPAGQPALALAQHFADSINATPCPDSQLFAEAYSHMGTTYFAVSVGSTVAGGTAFDLCVGPSGGPPGCCPTVGAGCSFNPTMTGVRISGNDCNENGQDDTIDIVSGRSSDRDNNGVPDDCENPACPADFNGDRVVNSQDFFDFLAAFFANHPSADFNRDNMVNSQDFFDFVEAFFAGC